MKGRILKHAGAYVAAAHAVEQGRTLDVADRFINNKATKYWLRADQIPHAEATIALFTRHEGDPQQNLFDMQCVWYEHAVAASHARQQSWGLALKKWAAIEKHYLDFIDDQFDFHSYCLRKMTLRAYVQMLRMCNRVLGHSVFVQAAHGVIQVHLRRMVSMNGCRAMTRLDTSNELHSRTTNGTSAPPPPPLSLSSVLSSVAGVSCSAADKAKAKRAAAKARKAEFRKAEEVALQSQLQKV